MEDQNQIPQPASNTTPITGSITSTMPPVSIAADAHPIESALAAPASIGNAGDACPTPPGLSARIDSLESTNEEIKSTIADIQARLEHHGIVGR